MLFVEVKQDVTEAQLKIYVDDFKKLDTNGDGFLDSKEVANMNTATPTLPRSHVPQPGCTLYQHSLFDKVFKYTESLLGREPSMAEFREFMADIDLSGDSRVSLSEFMRHLLGEGWTVEGV